MDLLSIALDPALIDVTTGGLVGFAAGYAAKRIAKLMILLLGFLVLLLEFLQSAQVIRVDYDALLALGQGVSVNVSSLNQLLLGTSVTIGAGFAAGFTLGLYKG